MPLYSPFYPTESYTLHNIGLTTSVATNALTINITASDGATTLSSGNPGYIAMRSSTLTSGGFNLRSVTGAVSLTVPSGATLGMASNVSGTLTVYAIDNAGTIELGVSFVPIVEGGVITTTAITSGSSSNNVIYSTSARSNVPFRIIGFITITEVTAGTWASNATQIQLWTPYTKIPLISAKYGNNIAQSVTTGADRQLFFEQKFNDNYNCVTNAGTAWLFTCPVAGTYFVSARLETATGFTVSAVSFFIAIYLNGSGYEYNADISALNSSSMRYTPGVYTTIQASAGDTFSIYANFPQTGSLNSSSQWNLVNVCQIPWLP